MKFEKQEGTPAPPAAPTQCPGTCNIPASTITSNPTVTCPCPEEKTCITTITSNHFEHTIKCGSKEVKKICGGPLYVSVIRFMKLITSYLKGHKERDFP